MIDFHSHIIYGIDDGSLNLKMSLDMLKNTEEQGIDYICATSHYKRNIYNCDKSTYFERLNELQSYSKVKILSGMEIFLDKYTLELLKNNTLWGIGDSKYVLIELPFDKFPKDVDILLNEIIIEGYKPIIAHIERYENFRNNVEMVEKFIEDGCLMQMNAGSILGNFGARVKHFSKILIKKHLIHVLGSDGHNVTTRTTNMKEGIKKIQKMNPELYKFILDNEEMILTQLRMKN